MSAQTPGAQSSGLAPNVASLLCYVCTFITGIIFLLIEKQNREVKFHAWQAIFLGLAFFVVMIALNILSAILGAMIGFLGSIFYLFTLVAQLGFIVVWIIAMVKAYQGEHFKLPVVGDLAEKQLAKS